MSFLYELLIQSLIVIYDFIFSIIYSMIEEPVLAIIGLSIIINLLVLPLYEKADQIQKEEQIKSLKMKDMVKHIRKTFHGDERFLILSAYYKIEHYSPFNTLKEAIPLALQIPFFMAAYKYISSLEFLDGVSFLMIKNLLAPDEMFKISSYNLNILPILMTMVNIISGYIYSKDGTSRQRIQIYVTAIIFLVLLYNSPSILVIYWLMNNIFSLGKNIYFRYHKEGRRILINITSVVLIVLIVIGIISSRIASLTDRLVAELLMIVCIINIMYSFIKLYIDDQPNIQNKNIISDFFSKRLTPEMLNIKKNLINLILLETGFVVLAGLYIPSSVLAASANEFVDSSTGDFLWSLLSYPTVVYAGILVIWLTVVVFSQNPVKRYYIISALWIFFGIALLNQFLFDPNVGSLYADLTFDNSIVFTLKTLLLNVAGSIIIAAILWFIYDHKKKAMNALLIIISFALLIMSMNNVRIIKDTLLDNNISGSDGSKPLKLSKNGKNVVVFMLDRAIGEYVPYIFNEKKELAEAYEGFTYYPNTISFGTHTNFGSPGLFGGYEYIPSEMNKRDNLSLAEKHDQALKLMPVLFMNNGYNVVICDPPYAGYQDVPDLSIYDEYPNINAYVFKGKYNSVFQDIYIDNARGAQKHNFLVYSIFRCSPIFMKKYLYDNGKYIGKAITKNYYPQGFIDTFSVLRSLSDITEIRDDNQDYFMLLQNNTPHNPVALNPPDYAIDNDPIDYDIKYSDREYEGKEMHIRSYSDWSHYCVNIATYSELVNWLDFMKENDVYDNTRIILVADHGYYLDQFDYLEHPDGLDIESLQPLLMVKDFDSKEPFKTDYTFMTNADTPIIAMDGVIENPINPFTNEPVTDKLKKEGKLLVTTSDNWVVSQNCGNTFETGSGTWWSVHDNIYDMNNWKKEY